MAICDFKPRPFAVGVTRTCYVWGESFEGASASMFAAGLIKPEWLPGLPGNGKLTQHVFIDESGATLIGPGCRRLKCMKRTLAKHQQLLKINYKGSRKV
jgi:hypothetical protein